MSAGNGNGSYSSKMIKRTVWWSFAVAVVVMAFGAFDGVVYHDGVPHWVGAMLWGTLGAAAVIAAIRALFNKI